METIENTIQRKYPKEPTKFEGFPKEPQTNYWPYPREVDGWWHKLTGGEQKVLDYILRHTWGYKKTTDKISFSQFEKGIYSKRTRKWIDRGTGLRSQAISNSIKCLEEKGFIIVNRTKGKATEFKLKTKEQLL